MTFKPRFFLFACLVLVCLTFTMYTFVVTTAQWREVPLIKLETSHVEFQGANFKAIAVSKSNQKALYAVELGTENLVRQNQETTVSEKTAIYGQNLETFTVKSQGKVYFADSESGVKTLDSKGRLSTLIDLPQVTSLSVFENNNLIAASPVKGKLLHLYNSEGSLLKSFGELKSFDTKNNLQNQFLNKGKTAVAPSGEIYYAYSFAPTPSIQKFSPDGRLVLQFPVEGEAINLQLKYQKDFLNSKESFCIGGVQIISSVAIDALSGNIFVGMNGSTKRNGISTSSGVIYEYDPNGIKLREYALVFAPNEEAKEILTGIKSISVTFPSLYVLTTQGKIHRFDLSAGINLAKNFKDVESKSLLKRFLPASWSPAGSTSAVQLPCPQAQTLTCSANCPEDSPDTTVDCAAAIRARLASNDIIISGSCSFSSNSCSGSGNVCNTQTGERPTISISLSCREPEPPPPPGGGGEEQACIDQCRTWNTSPAPGWCEPFRPGECASPQAGCNCSPIVIDVAGNGFDLTNAANGVTFDLNGDNVINSRLAWTTADSDDAWLALDRNNNGKIDNGRELFGNFTPQPNPPSGEEKHGFRALARYDKPQHGGNDNCWIDANDNIFSSLRLWQDTNHNGISEQSELHTLPSKGVTRLDLDYRESRRSDTHGNRFKYRAKVRDAQGAQIGRWAWDVFLRFENLNP